MSCCEQLPAACRLAEKGEDGESRNGLLGRAWKRFSAACELRIRALTALPVMDAMAQTGNSQQLGLTCMQQAIANQGVLE